MQPSEPVRPTIGQRRRVPAVLRRWASAARQRFWALLRGTATAFPVMAVTLWLLPGVRAHDVVDVLGLVALIAAVGAVVRPAVTAAATAVGGPGALLLGVAAQAMTTYVALRLDEDAPVSGVPAAVAVSWTSAVLSTALNRLLDAGTDETFVRETVRLMRRVRRRDRRRNGTATHGPGLLVVQLDGVSAPVLRWAVRAGNLPTLARWLGPDGGYRLAEWHTGIPATTPAAQAGILYGTASAVPGYRWYDKAAGRMVVMSRPRDAAEVQTRLPADRALLRDGGVGISNVFTGGAPTALFTVSRGRRLRG